MPKQRVKTVQEKEKRRHRRMNRRSLIYKRRSIVGRVGRQGETLGTVGWTDGPFSTCVGRVAEEEQGRQ
jgi:hypothetical protein